MIIALIILISLVITIGLLSMSSSNIEPLKTSHSYSEEIATRVSEKNQIIKMEYVPFDYVLSCDLDEENKNIITSIRLKDHPFKEIILFRRNRIYTFLYF